MIFLDERCPTGLRARGTAVSWNLGFMLGGLMPTLVSLLSPELADVPSRLAMFLVGATVVFVLAVLTSPETSGALDRERHDRTVADGTTAELPGTPSH